MYLCGMMYRLVSETFHFACLLTAATILPCMCIIGPSLVMWIYVWTWEGYASFVIFCRVVERNRPFATVGQKVTIYLSALTLLVGWQEGQLSVLHPPATPDGSDITALISSSNSSALAQMWTSYVEYILICCWINCCLYRKNANSALTLIVGCQEEHPIYNEYIRWCRSITRCCLMPSRPSCCTQRWVWSTSDDRWPTLKALAQICCYCHVLSISGQWMSLVSYRTWQCWMCCCQKPNFLSPEFTKKFQREVPVPNVPKAQCRISWGKTLCKNQLDLCSHFNTIPACNRHTPTDTWRQHIPC